MEENKKLLRSTKQIHYSRTMTPDNLSKASNMVGKLILNGLGRFGQAFNNLITSGATTDFGLTSPFVMSSVEERKAIQKGKQLAKEKANEKIAEGMTWVSPLNYGAALWNGHGLDAKAGEEEIASWAPAWLAVGRIAEIGLTPKVGKSVSTTAKSTVRSAKGLGSVYKSLKYLRKLEKEYDKASSEIEAKYSKDAPKDLDVVIPKEGQEALEKLYEDYENKLYGENTDISGLSYFSKDNSLSSKIARKRRKLDDSELFSSPEEVIKLSVKDFDRVESGHWVSLTDNYALSKDSYPLLVSISRRRMLQNKGKIVPVIDNGTHRMIKLNLFGKNKKSFSNIDKQIKLMRQITGDYSIPDRVSIFGQQYVPAFRFLKYKKGGTMQLLKNGSGIHIKKKNRGKFTLYCGGKVTDSCIRRAKASGNPTLVKRATFAANARKWKHLNGGIITNNWYEQFKKEHPTITEVASYLPVVGSAMDVYEAVNNPTGGNIANAAISVGADILGYRLLKNAGKAYKALKASRKIEYDDLIRRGFGRTYARERTRPNLLYDPEYTRYGNALLGTQAGDKIINYSQNRMEKEKSRKLKASLFKQGGIITINNELI